MIFFQMNYPTHKTTLSYFVPTEYSHPICVNPESTIPYWTMWNHTNL